MQKFFPSLITAIAERINEKRRTSLPYLFKEKLTPKYSSDGRWTSVLAEYSRVAADVVALDTSLPLKSRDTLETASGAIPKLGMKLYLTEKQMKDIDSMIAQGNVPLNRIVDNIFADSPRCIEGVWERIEDIFLSELSSGVGLASRDGGTGVRIDMGFYEANQFGVESLWSEDGATPLTDIQKVVDKAIEDQNSITDAYLDDVALNALYKNGEVRAQYAFDKGIAMTASTAIPVLDFDKVAAIFASKWQITLHRVARKIKTELNGVKQSHNPWKKGVISFVCDEELGSLVYTDVAEASRPVEGVEYQTVEDYILIKKYSVTDPLREFTASEAMVVPVLNNVDRIYTLDSQTVAA